MKNILAIFFLILAVCSCSSPEHDKLAGKNLDFQTTCDSLKTGLCNWKVSWGKDEYCNAGVEGDNQYLSLYGPAESNVTFVEQAIAITAWEDIRLLKVSAKVRAKEVIGRGTGLNVAAYNAANELLVSKDMGGVYSEKWLKGDVPWETQSIEIICPPDAVEIRLGAILYGGGTADFDDYEIELETLQGREPSELARSYVSQAIKIIEENSVVRDSIDTGPLEEKALQVAGNAENYEDCRLAIEFIVATLNSYDHHSFYTPAEDVRSWANNSDAESQIEYAEVRKLNDVGYINVPGFHSGNPELMVSFADSLQVSLQEMYSKGVQGWIVDLRQNDGGNMEPMITGLGPLLDDGDIGSLLDVNGGKEHWYYKEGTYFWEQEAGTSLQDPYVIPEKLPIAVLIGPATGSSGEIVVISFVGNTLTRSFGEPTWGLTTGNGEFDLPDGARMWVSSTYMVDRNGTVYNGSIEPDELISNEENNEEDKVLDAALRWIAKTRSE